MIPEILSRIPDVDTFVDVFTGGGSVAIAYAETHPHSKILMNDLDKFTFSLWDVVVNGTPDDMERLSEYIQQPVTIDLFKHNRTLMESKDRVVLAYLGVFFHKTTFSGMFNGSPIGGFDQKSEWTVGCHYNARPILEKIYAVRRLLSGRTTVTNLDFRNVPVGDFAYFDPPYVTVGDKIYAIPFNETLHRALAEHLHRRGNWLLSYNDCPLIRELYSNCKVYEHMHKISMSSFCEEKKCRIKTELLISPI
jgi:DNA adenine methylase